MFDQVRDSAIRVAGYPVSLLVHSYRVTIVRCFIGFAFSVFIYFLLVIDIWDTIYRQLKYMWIVQGLWIIISLSCMLPGNYCHRTVVYGCVSQQTSSTTSWPTSKREHTNQGYHLVQTGCFSSFGTGKISSLIFLGPVGLSEGFIDKFVPEI